MNNTHPALYKYVMNRPAVDAHEHLLPESVRLAVGKQFVNVSLNLAWCHILNPSATVRAMIDLINAVPINKVLAMGGDYWRLPDVAYGHLKLARELLCRALAACREKRWITEADARRIADRWLFYNAYDIYPLLPKGNAISGKIH